jgi:cytochrome c-type biogenesis protein CcmE
MLLKNKFLAQRVLVILFFIFIASVGLIVLLYTFNNNIVLYQTPSMLLVDTNLENKAKFIRVGGIVKDGSVKYNNGTIKFIIYDDKKEMEVVYKGLIPSLFKEGQNVIMYGKFNKDEGQFKAKELLAKHDENYIPKNYKNAKTNLK